MGPIRGEAPTAGTLTTEEEERIRRDIFWQMTQARQSSTELPTADLRLYVERVLRHAMPQGWVAHFRPTRSRQHLPASELTAHDYNWKICPDNDQQEDPFYYYLLYLDGRGSLVLVYGNTDAGVPTVRNLWERAMVIDCGNAPHVLPYIFARQEQFPPNHYGLS